jgi:hypothetical protein
VTESTSQVGTPTGEPPRTQSVICLPPDPGAATGGPSSAPWSPAPTG